MRYMMRVGRDPCELPVAAGPLKEVAAQLGITKNTMRQQMCRASYGEFRQTYIWVNFDADLEGEIMAEEAMDMIRTRMDSERRKAEDYKGKPAELVYRHTANVLRSILIDLEDFQKDTRNAPNRRK